MPVRRNEEESSSVMNFHKSKPRVYFRTDCSCERTHVLVGGDLLLIIGVFQWTDSCTAVAIPPEDPRRTGSLHIPECTLSCALICGRKRICLFFRVPI